MMINVCLDDGMYGVGATPSAMCSEDGRVESLTVGAVRKATA